MRLGKLDLNLLVVLDTLLTEQSVSLAAGKLCLSQSAVSSALGRLREYFADELLVVKGRKMIPTARAEALATSVHDVLEHIRRTITVVPPFEPATADRQIGIMASDYLTEVLLNEALAEIAQKAPGLRFEILSMNDVPDSTLERGDIDLLITTDYAVSPNHPNRLLFEDDYVVLGWAENPAMLAPMTQELYFRLGHITARFGKSRVVAFDEWFTRHQKQQRRIEVVTPNFLSLAGLVVNTHRIATVHRRMATSIARDLPLLIREIPFNMPSIREVVQWHSSKSNDNALRWVVDHLESVASRKDITLKNNHFQTTSMTYDRQNIELQFRLNALRI